MIVHLFFLQNQYFLQFDELPNIINFKKLNFNLYICYWLYFCLKYSKINNKNIITFANKLFTFLASFAGENEVSFFLNEVSVTSNCFFFDGILIGSNFLSFFII